MTHIKLIEALREMYVYFLITHATLELFTFKNYFISFQLWVGLKHSAYSHLVGLDLL